MSLCKTWVVEELAPGQVHPIASAQFRYNGTVVGVGTVEAKSEYDMFTSSFIIDLTITDSTTNTYTYNEIMILDKCNVNVALFTYSKPYTKGTGALTVKESIYIPQSVPPIDLSIFGVTVLTWGEVVSNALINGGTVYSPNIILVVNDLLIILDQIPFTPSIDLTPSSYDEYETISCDICFLQPSLFVILAYFDASKKEIVIVGFQNVLGGFTNAKVEWSIPFNPNC